MGIIRPTKLSLASTIVYSGVLGNPKHVRRVSFTSSQRLSKDRPSCGDVIQHVIFPLPKEHDPSPTFLGDNLCPVILDFQSFALLSFAPTIISQLVVRQL
jgi:hypothetical protein